MRTRGLAGTFVVLALAATLALPVASALAAPAATVITASPTPGTTSLQVGVAIPKSIDDAARNHNVGWTIDVSVTYLSVNNTIEMIDSGPLSISNDTIFVGSIDRNTDAIQVTISFAGHPAPGNQPSYTGTAQLLHP